MGNSLESYRSSIGSFQHCIKGCSWFKFPGKLFNTDFKHNFSYGLNEWSNIIYRQQMNKQRAFSVAMVRGTIALSHVIFMLIVMCGDVQPNPGPTSNYADISVSHSNIRSLKGKNKMTSIQAELVSKFDIITLSETWLTEQDSSDDFLIPGY